MCWGLIPSSAIKTNGRISLLLPPNNNADSKLTLEQRRLVVKVRAGSGVGPEGLAHRIHRQRGRCEDLARVHIRVVVAVILVVVGGRCHAARSGRGAVRRLLVVVVGVVERLKVPGRQR